MARFSYTAAMDTPWNPRHLDIRAFARSSGLLHGQTSLAQWPRLQAEQFEGDGKGSVDWRLQGALNTLAGGGCEVMLSLRAETRVPLQCQRCLHPVNQTVLVERQFLFAADEAAAEAMDADSELDVLVISRDFDALSLVEDELIMALPMVPRHEVCPQSPPASAQDEAFADAGERAHPFAGLAALKNRT